MKKNIFAIVTLILVLVSCKPTDEKPLGETDKEGKPAKDSTLVGADKDENGCLASAGYTWSKVNKECVRAFTGIQLNPVENAQNEDATLSVYVLFNENGDKAEVFLPSEESLVLTRESEGKPWIYNDYQLIPWKGYVFKKGDKILYTGDGEVGNKVTGSDKNED
jgi:hypothetical protein